MNCIVAQSGGPTAAINATLAGVIKGAFINNFDNVYGSISGIEGILNNNIVNLNVFKDEDKFALLKQTPSAFLGSCRKKLPEYTENEEIFKQITDFMLEKEIGFFFYIGGNDSMDTVAKLSRYVKAKNIDIKCMGVPKTIDNDLPVTDHTPGFGSAAKYIATTVREITCDSRVYDKDTVTIVEIMGRDAGWLTASSALARRYDGDGPHLIYLPERSFDIEKFLINLTEVVKKEKNAIVCVSEGIKDKDGTYICEKNSSGLYDTFGHKYLSGTAKVLEDLVRARLGFKVRGIELSVSQRCAGHTISLRDIEESVLIGKSAVEFALMGKSGEIVLYKRLSDNPYKIHIESHNIEDIANLEQTVPDNMINAEGNDVTDAMITYLKPLVEGQYDIIYKNSLPEIITLKDILS